jgi:hypothetical protein
MHSHIAVINEDNKVIAVVKLGDQFMERLNGAISDETGEEADVYLPREAPSPELIRFQVEVLLNEGSRALYLAPTWEY